MSIVTTHILRKDSFEKQIYIVLLLVRLFQLKIVLLLQNCCLVFCVAAGCVCFFFSLFFFFFFFWGGGGLLLLFLSVWLTRSLSCFFLSFSVAAFSDLFIYFQLFSNFDNIRQAVRIFSVSPAWQRFFFLFFLVQFSSFLIVIIDTNQSSEHLTRTGLSAYTSFQNSKSLRQWKHWHQRKSSLTSVSKLYP